MKVKSRILGKIYIVKDDDNHHHEDTDDNWTGGEQRTGGIGGKGGKEGKEGKELNTNRYWLQVNKNDDSVSFVKDKQDTADVWYFTGKIFHRPYRFVLCDSYGKPIFWHGDNVGLNMKHDKSASIVTLSFNDDNCITLYIGTQKLPFQAYWYANMSKNMSENIFTGENDGNNENNGYAMGPMFDEPKIQNPKPWFNWYNVGFWVLLFIILISLITLLFVAINGLDQQKRLMSDWIIIKSYT